MILTREAAKILDLTPAGVTRLVRCGDLKPAAVIPVGARGVYMYNREDVVKLAASRTRGHRRPDGDAE